MTDLVSVGNKEVEAWHYGKLSVIVEEDLSVLRVRDINHVVSGPWQAAAEDISVLQEETFIC